MTKKKEAPASATYALADVLRAAGVDGSQLDQPFEITEALSLDALGYDEGSEAVVVLNPTRAVRQAWNWCDVVYLDRYDALGEPTAEEVAALEASRAAVRYQLFGLMCREVTLKRGDTSRTWVMRGKPEAVAEVDNIDDALLTVIFQERARLEEDRLNRADATFRARHPKHALRPGAQAAGTPTDGPRAGRDEGV